MAASSPPPQTVQQRGGSAGGQPVRLCVVARGSPGIPVGALGPSHNLLPVDGWSLGHPGGAGETLRVTVALGGARWLPFPRGWGPGLQEPPWLGEAVPSSILWRFPGSC